MNTILVTGGLGFIGSHQITEITGLNPHTLTSRKQRRSPCVQNANHSFWISRYHY